MSNVFVDVFCSVGVQFNYFGVYINVPLAFNWLINMVGW